MNFVLRLYVTGDSSKSDRAIANLQALAAEYFLNRATIEIIDVLVQPEEAMKMHIIATPTLIKESPAPVRRVIGDLSNVEAVLFGLGIKYSDLYHPEGNNE